MFGGTKYTVGPIKQWSRKTTIGLKFVFYQFSKLETQQWCSCTQSQSLSLKKFIFKLFGLQEFVIHIRLQKCQLPIPQFYFVLWILLYSQKNNLLTSLKIKKHFEK